MEEEKPQSPAAAAHQIDGAAANVAAGVFMQEEAVAADRDAAAAAVRDEALAGAFQMEYVREMTGSELSAVPARLQDYRDFAAFSGTADHRFPDFARIGRQDLYAGRASAAGQNYRFANVPSAGLFPVEHPIARFSSARVRDPYSDDLLGNGDQDPIAGAQMVTTETDLLRRCGDHDDVAASPSVQPSPVVDDVVSSKRRSLLADADAQIIFAGMAEEHDNDWYEAIISDAANMQMEELGFRESLRQCVPVRYEAPHSTTAAVVAVGEDEHEELCLQNFCKKWNICPSDLAPDEPGPSTKPAKVPALADDEVPKFDCGICMETLDVFDLFHGMLCEHKFCTACMEAYVEGRIRDGDLPIPCPDPACKGEDDGMLHPEKCKKAIDFAAFGDWGARLTERAVPANRRAYCPNRRCGLLLETSSEQKPARTPCPACKQPLCAACGMEWSADGSGEHDCAKGPDAALVMKLAAQRRWKQCPKCKMVVEKIDGCNTMNCRCRCVFCYRCGRPLTPPQAAEVGGEPCRCNHAGIAVAFAFVHDHRLRFDPDFLDAGDVDEGREAADDAAEQELHAAVHAFDLNINGGGGDPAQQQDEM